MIRLLTIITFVISASYPAVAGAAVECLRKDQGFHAFLAFFRSDQAFRQSRILFPLRVMQSKGQSARLVYLSKAEIGAGLGPDGPALLRSNAASSNSGRTATECESTTRHGDQYASVFSYSCSDAGQATQYEFSSKGGCWHLSNVFQHINSVATPH